MYGIIKKIFVLLVIFSTSAVYAIETHTRLWTSAQFVGSLTDDKKVKYLLEPTMRFVDSKYKFSQTQLWAGIGYQIAPKAILYIGDAPVVTRSLSGIYSHDNIIWQQLNSGLIDTDDYFVGSRSRLMQIKRFGESEWGLVLRQRILYRKPLQFWQDRAAVVSDEVYIDINHPSWFGARSTVSQNRFFIGINTKLTSVTTLLVGYMNQFLFTHPNQMSNILFIQFEVDSDKYKYDDIQLS